MILSARFVKHPDKRFICDDCNAPIYGPLIRLYGMAYEDEKPYTLRLHIHCIAQSSSEVLENPKLKGVLPYCVEPHDEPAIATHQNPAVSNYIPLCEKHYKEVCGF
jgi:hypothetical protein